MRTNTWLNLLRSAWRAQGAEHPLRTSRPHPWLHHLAPALPAAPVVFLWPQDSAVSPSAHQLPYQSIWSDMRAPLLSSGKYFTSSWLYALHVLEHGMRVVCEKSKATRYNCVRAEAARTVQSSPKRRHYLLGEDSGTSQPKTLLADKLVVSP